MPNRPTREDDMPPPNPEWQQHLPEVQEEEELQSPRKELFQLAQANIANYLLIVEAMVTMDFQESLEQELRHMRNRIEVMKHKDIWPVDDSGQPPAWSAFGTYGRVREIVIRMTNSRNEPVGEGASRGQGVFGFPFGGLFDFRGNHRAFPQGGGDLPQVGQLQLRRPWDVENQALPEVPRPLERPQEQPQERPRSPQPRQRQRHPAGAQEQDPRVLRPPRFGGRLWEDRERRRQEQQRPEPPRGAEPQPPNPRRRGRRGRRRRRLRRERNNAPEPEDDGPPPLEDWP
jgi:hypothetical protein